MSNIAPPASPEVSDAVLARRAADRRSAAAAHAAFDVLIQRYWKLVYVYIRTRSGPSGADDAAQEVWLKAWKALETPGRFDGSNFKAWLFEIARNHLIDVGRRRRMALAGDGAAEPVDHRYESAEDAEERRLFQETLTRCLEALEAAERQVVVARLEGIRPAEIADKAKVKPERVHKLFFQAKAKLQACAERSSR